MKALAFILPMCLATCATISVPLGSDSKYGRIIVGYQPPPNFSAWSDAPKPLTTGDFKRVLNPKK